MLVKPGRGFTAVEIMVVVALLCVIVAIAVPSFQGAIERARLKSAAEALLADIYTAKSEALRTGQAVFYSVRPGAQDSWCYGMNIGSPCDCEISAAQCKLRSASQADYRGVRMSASTLPPGASSFDPMRGMASGSGLVTFTVPSGQVLKTGITAVGRAYLCSPEGAGNVPGYGSADC